MDINKKLEMTTGFLISILKIKQKLKFWKFDDESKVGKFFVDYHIKEKNILLNLEYDIICLPHTRFGYIQPAEKVNTT